MASIEDSLIQSAGTLENKKIYLIKCAVPKCPTRATSGFAKFPSEPSLRDIWFKLCGLSVLGKDYYIDGRNTRFCQLPLRGDIKL